MPKPSDMERVRANTPAEINWRIDRQIEDSVRRYASEPKDVILRRVWELEHEWDIERVLQLMASSVSLTGILMAVVRDKRWIVLPVMVLSFLFLHAVQGWCPPVPVLRRLGVRTREEIDRERHALKVLVGDFPTIANLQAGAATH
jgi:hypothetical protein